MSTRPVVEVQGLRKEYGQVVAVEDLSFSVGFGEIMGVLGPNGAGKTTAIRILTTILFPTRGTFSVAGIPHKRSAEIRSRIGVLPESSGYPERQTGADYLRYHARLFGHDRAGAVAMSRALLEEVGLAERARWPITSYSRGMRQRLGIARALVNDPAVVFLDEPTLGLDPAGQRQMLALIREIARERGTTVLLSTHLLAEVEETCSRVLILNRGRVAADGTVAEVAGLAAAPRSARLRVPPDRADAARRILAAAPGVQQVDKAEGQAGTLTVLLNGPSSNGHNESLQPVVAAGVPVLAFELEGARLSDAFLAMTESV